MSPLLLVANDLYHHHEHRIRHLSAFLEEGFRLHKVSLVPPGLGIGGEQVSSGAFLRGWPRRVIMQRYPIIWRVGTTTAVRRSPLPSLLGPLVNRSMLRRALLRAVPTETVAVAQGPVPAMACRDRGIRYVYDHADDYGGGRVDALHRGILGRWQHDALREAEAVSCAGSALYRHATEAGARSVHLHPNGVQIDAFGLPRAESPEPTVLFIGGLERDCGLDLVFKALAMMKPEVRCIVAGDGPAREALGRLARRLGITERVRWQGRIAGRDRPALLSTAWVGIAVFLPTRWNRHAFHLKVLEYLAAGLPFVTTPVGDGAQMAEESGAGAVAAPEPSAVAACLSDLLARSDLRGVMSARAREAAAAYDWGIVGPRFAQWVLATLAGIP